MKNDDKQKRRTTSSHSTYAQSLVCPICQKSFPSVRTMDPLDHELKLIRHITRCTSINDQRTSRQYSPKKKNEPSRAMTNQWKQKNNEIPMLSQDNSLPSLVSQDEICQESNKVGKNVCNSNKSAVLCDTPYADVIPRGRIGGKKKIERSNVLINADTESDMASTLSSLPSEVKKGYSEMSTAYCAERQTKFIKLNSLKECIQKQDANDATTCEPTLITHPKHTLDMEKSLMPRKSSKKSLDTKEKKRSIHQNEKKHKASDLRLSNKRCKSTPPPNSNDHILATITDPRHFRFQTWWRTKRTRQSVETIPFDIQQCIVETKSEDNKEESVRVRSRRGPRLELRCPICCRVFMGSVTEESMSRHFTKCNQRMFTTGIGMTNFAASMHGTNIVDVKTTTKQVMINSRKSKLCPENRPLRVKALADRAISIRSLRQCDYAKAFTVACLTSSI